MKTNPIVGLITVACLGFQCAPSAVAQLALSGGSDSSYGPINITSNTTLNLPDDGVFNATTITVVSNATLSFNRNAHNTTVALLATGDVMIAGKIDVSGAPGSGITGGAGVAGGGDGGRGSSEDVLPQAGFGPGAGVGGRAGGGAGAYRTVPDNPSAQGGVGATYGNSLLIPMLAGSGGSGAGSGGGGAGGGAVLIASNTRITIPAGGQILARGGASVGYLVGSGALGGGSGGAIRLAAPEIVGAGLLAVNGGPCGSGPTAGEAGHGRIRIDTLTTSGIAFTYGGGSASIGSAMIARLSPSPRLDIVEAAGQSIPLNSSSVVVLLPQGSSSNLTVKVQAQGFGAQLPTRLYATPDEGVRTVYSATLDNTTINPRDYTFNITVPVNMRVRLQAFAGNGLP